MRFVSLTSSTTLAFLSFSSLATPSLCASKPKPFGVVNKPGVKAGDTTLAPSPNNDGIEVDEKLTRDIEMLSNMLSDVVKRENPKVYESYNQLRKHGIDRAADPNNINAFEQMKKLVRVVSPTEALGIMRVFSVALNLVNAAEVHHRLRSMKEDELARSDEHVGPLPMVEDSVRGTIETVLENKEGNEEAIYNSLLQQKVEIVITAHPTEGKRTNNHNKSLVEASSFTVLSLTVTFLIFATIILQ